MVLRQRLVVHAQVPGALFPAGSVRRGVGPAPGAVLLIQVPGSLLFPGGAGYRQAADVRGVQKEGVQQRISIAARVTGEQRVHRIGAGGGQGRRVFLRQGRADPAAEPAVQRSGRLRVFDVFAARHDSVQFGAQAAQGGHVPVQQVIPGPGKQILARRVQAHGILRPGIGEHGDLRAVPRRFPFPGCVKARRLVKGEKTDLLRHLLRRHGPAPGIVRHDQHGRVRAVSVRRAAQPGLAVTGCCPGGFRALFRAGGQDRGPKNEYEQD